MTPRHVASTTAEGVLGDRYDVIALIGTGTAADVFRVRDCRSGVVRAAKVLKPGNARTPEVLARFEDEYRILRTLHHPHLPEVYDYGWTADGGRFLVMELVDGEPLDLYFRARPRELWVILYQICEILTFIHNHRLLHQDIKPGNILVKRTTAFGDEIPLVKLIDFGLTYRRDAGERVRMVGTPEYMAPEVVRGDAPLNRAVDYYSLGVVLYELLCGRTPFQGDTAAVLRAHLDTIPEIEEELLEWAELYPHVRALLLKDKRARLEAFEELRRAVVTRLTGGIGALDRAYGAARVESLGMIGKEAELRELLGATLSSSESSSPAQVSVSGQPLSGRSNLLEAVRSEWRIRGIASWQLGDDSDAARLLNRPAGAASLPTEKDFEQAWGRVERSAMEAPVWVVASGELSAEEARLYEYFETGRTLAGPVVRRNVGFVTATAADRVRPPLESDEGVRIRIPSLTESAISAVVDRFRGEMLRTADAQLIAELLKGVRESGEVMLLLRRLIGRGGLLFEAQRWRVVPEKARTIAHEPAATGGHLVLPLSPVQRRVMVCLSCHPGPVPVGWIPGIAGLDDGVAASVLHDLRLRHLVEPVDVDGTPAVRTTSRTIEQAVLRDAEASEIAEIHRIYVGRLAARVAGSAAAAADDLRTLALHQEGSGDDRAAYLTRRTLFRELWRRRAYGEIEQLCRDAMAPKRLRFGLARAYLRELVNVLWAQNLTTRAYHDMKAFADRHGEVPRGLLPKYARGLSDALGPKEGLRFIDEMLEKTRDVGMGLFCRLQIERALCAYNLSHHVEGLVSTDLVMNMAIELPERDRCRLYIYRHLLQVAAGSTDESDVSLRDADHIAITGGLMDEQALIQVIRIFSEVDEGRPDSALRIATKALRDMSRRRLLLRQLQVMSQVSSAYSELGDARRASKWRIRVISLAQYLGQRQLLGAAWWRLATYAQKRGEYGNALRYFRSALQVLDDNARPADLIYANVLMHDLQHFLGMPQQGSVNARVRRILSRTRDIGEHGTLLVYRAGQLLREQRYPEARDAFMLARAECSRGGRRDDVMRAMLGEIRALVEMGRFNEGRSALLAADRQFAGLQTADVVVSRCLVGLLLSLGMREHERKVVDALNGCRQVLDRAEMATRIDLLKAMFRAHARKGDVPEVTRLYAELEDDIRAIVANLEVGEFARRFLRSVGFTEIQEEYALIQKRTARAE